MALETATTIAGLVSTNPVGGTDSPSSLDDHIRLLKTVLKADALVDADIGVTVPALAHTHTGTYAPVGALTGSGLTIGTGKLAGRTTAGTGALEEISVGANLTFTGGTLTATTQATTFSSSAENIAGTIENKAVDPLGIREAFNATGSAPVYACRAWVNFNGTVSGTFAGGTSTVTRDAGTTTATVTCNDAHLLITGNKVRALTGVVAGTYEVTVVTDKIFSFTTVATTLLAGVPITFDVSAIRASGNVSSITDNAIGSFTINFSTAMPDVNYAIAGTAGLDDGVSGTDGGCLYPNRAYGSFSTTSIGVSTSRGAAPNTGVDYPIVVCSVHR